MMQRSWTLYLLCLVLPACLHKPQARYHSEKDSFSTKPESSFASHFNHMSADHFDNQDYRLLALSYEAKLPDIPIPVASDPIPYFFEEREHVEDIALGYITATDIERLMSFFKAEFVQLGWKILAEAHYIESLLIVEKPDRICTVSFRSMDGFNIFIITVCLKVNL